MNHPFLSNSIKILSIVVIICFFIGTVVTAEEINPQISVTRTKDTYPTTLTIHTELIKDQAETSDNLKIRVLDSSTLVEEKLLNVGVQKQDLNGKDYIKYATTKEFSEEEALKTYTYTVYLLDSGGKEKGLSSVAYAPKSLTQGETKTVKQAGGGNKTIEDTTYTYLEPLPGFGNTFDIKQPGAISNYVGILFKLILGVMGVIAVFEIIRLGIQTMSDSFTQKGFAKKRLTNIIASLIIALCSVLILRTINPKLVDFSLGIKRLDISIAAQDFRSAQQQELKENPKAGDLSTYKLEGTFEKPIPSSSEVKECADALAGGKKLGYIMVRAIAPFSARNEMYLIFEGGGRCAVAPVNIGWEGVTDWPVSAPNKTPRGANGPDKNSMSKTSTATDKLPKKGVPAVCVSGAQKFNCGAAFIDTGITTSKGEPRFIGIHGQGDNKIGTTAGCIKMKNDDLVLLAKYMTGVNFKIVSK